MLVTKKEDFGNYTYVKSAAKLSDTPGTIRKRAPYLGEHTQEVLESAGYTKEEIAAMHEKGDIPKKKLLPCTKKGRYKWH